MPPTNRRTPGLRKPKTTEDAVTIEVLDPPSTPRKSAPAAPRKRTAARPAPARSRSADVVDEPETVAVVPAEARADDDVVDEAVTTETETDTDEATGRGDVTLEKPARPQGRRTARPVRPSVVADEDSVTADDDEVAEVAESGPSALRRITASPTSTKALAAWGAAALVLVLVASLFGALWYRSEYAGPAANRALVDVGATSLAAQQIGEAVKTVYSYDFARLDENERNARAVVAPEFEEQFTRVYQEVRTLAPQQQAVVTATVALSGVQRLTDDTAVMVMFVDQIATRTPEGGTAQRSASAGRLIVTARMIDGAWKIVDVKGV